MPGTQELTRRIKSVKSTRKVTRAMQMVSAAKMRKAQSAALASREYAKQIRGLLSALEARDEALPPLAESYPEAPRIAIVVVSTNRGLVGGFNTSILSELRNTIQEANIEADLIFLGKKVAASAARIGMGSMMEFTKEDTMNPEQLQPIITAITDLYASKQYRAIFICYTHFVSTISQKATSKQILPLVPESTPETPVEYVFEPSPSEVLNQLIPRLLESQLYQAVLESDASEHSSRMLMMKNATDAAGDLITDLTFTFNQMRQNKITTELSEITAGKLALEN